MTQPWFRSLRPLFGWPTRAPRRTPPLNLETLESRLTPAGGQALALSPSVLPSDSLDVAYNQTISATGGTGAATLAVSNLQNPIAGLSLPTTGTTNLTISGTPTATGTERFTVTATDAVGNTTSLNYSITVNTNFTLSPATLPADTVNVPYNQAFTNSGAVNSFYANQVVNYVPGAIPNASYNNPASALGGLNPVEGSFSGIDYYLTPFDPAFSSTDLVEVGAGGSLTLKLAQTATTNGYTLGVHTGFGLLDADYPNGTNSNPASYTDSWLRQADVRVSADGVHWGDLGTITFNNPSNYNSGAATDIEGLSPGVGPAADMGKPFLGSLSSFNGQDKQGTLALLNGSAGGTWLNLSGVVDETGTAISGVNYVQFSVPNNPPLDPNTGKPEIMMVDAVVGTNGNASIHGNGGTGAVTLTVSNIQNAIPGLVVPASGADNLIVSGTPTAPGTESFTVTATDSAGNSTTANYSVTVNPSITLTSTNGGNNLINTPYQQTITASGGTGTFTLSIGNIQNAIPGLVLPASGRNSLTIGGTPSTTGVETFNVTAVDSVGGTTTTTYTVTVNPNWQTSGLVSLPSQPSPLGTPLTNANAAFVDGLYASLLGRHADAAGLNYWEGVLQSQSQSAVVQGILNSTEYRSDEVANYFQTFLGRSPVAGEASYWVQAFQSGATEQQVMLGFLTSPEYQSAHASRNSFAAGLYQAVLGRTAAANEVAIWANSDLSEAQIAQGIINSPEALSNVVHGLYSAILARTGSSAEVSGWLGTLASNQDQLDAALVGFLTSPEFNHRTAPGTL